MRSILGASIGLAAVHWLEGQTAIVFSVATVVYLFFGSPLHRRASDAFHRRSLDLYGILSLTSSVLYLYSTLVSAAWRFFPRYFPLRYLEPDLKVRVYFLHACAVVLFGLLVVLFRGESKNKI